jgi:hypothetical protein
MNFRKLSFGFFLLGLIVFVFSNDEDRISSPINTLKLKNNVLTHLKAKEECIKFKISNYPNSYITSNACLQNQDSLESPFLINSKQEIDLIKPKLGKAKIIIKDGKVFSKEINVLNIDECAALFILDNKNNKAETFNFKNYPGSPVIQIQHNTEIVVGLIPRNSDNKTNFQSQNKKLENSGVIIYKKCKI